MKRALVATGLLAMSASTASAGGYLGIALGNQPAVNEEMETKANAIPVGRSLRGLGGYRHGNLSLEGTLNGFGVSTGRGDRTVYQLSGAFKLNLPLGNDFEAFGKVGLERTWLNVGDERYNLTGNGLMGGAGFEYRLTRILANASAFVDYTIHHATLKDARNNTVDETSRIWALGLAYGF
jgi:Outer membrane protein beta-barrel domain